jgi:hypothetical protein
VEWSGRASEITVKAICQECNSRWLNDEVEQPVQQFLIPMLHGRPTYLHADQQRLLALWTAKTAMLADLLRPNDRLIPDETFGALHQARTAPLASQHVWVGYRSKPNDGIPTHGFFQLAKITPLPTGTDFYFWGTTITVGCVVLQVIGHNAPEGVTSFINRANSAIRPIWPSVRPFRWPAGLFNIDGVPNGMHHLNHDMRQVLDNPIGRITVS